MKNLSKLILAIAILAGIVAVQGKCFAWSISGTVYERDGTGLRWITLTLYDSSNNTLGTYSNDKYPPDPDAGKYIFSGLSDGTYKIIASRNVQGCALVIDPNPATVIVSGADVTKDFHVQDRPPEIKGIYVFDPPEIRGLYNLSSSISLNIQPGQIIDFKIWAEDPNLDIMNYYIIDPIDNNYYLNDQSGQFIWVPDYNQAGTHTLRFYATDNPVYGKLSSNIAEITINVAQRTPGQMSMEISREAGSIPGNVPYDVRFKAIDIPSNAIPFASKPFHMWWDFGDGGCIPGVYPGNIYSKEGKSTATLKIIDDNFNTIAQAQTDLDVLPEREPLRTFYVDTNNPNASDNYTEEQARNPDTPWKTFSKGFYALKPGDRLYLREGTYQGGVVRESYHGSGTVDKPIWISGCPGEHVVINGNIGFVNGASHHRLENLDISYDGVEAVSAWVDHITVRNCIVREGSLWYKASDVSPWGLIENCQIIRKKITGDRGAFQPKGSYTVAKNNYIEDTIGEGMVAKNGPRYSQFYGNFINNSQVRLGGMQNWWDTRMQKDIGEGLDLSFHNNIVIGNVVPYQAFRISIFRNTFYYTKSGYPWYKYGVITGVGYRELKSGLITTSNPYYCSVLYNSEDLFIRDNILVSAPGTTDINFIKLPYATCRRIKSDNNLIWPHFDKAFTYDDTLMTLAEWRSATGQDLRSIEQDPLFVNQQLNDFHLNENSPAIDSGTNFPFGGKDYEGNIRPVGAVAAYDIGAYEYTGEAQPTLAGDFNNDNVVDIKDLILVAKYYGTTYNISHIILVAKNYGRTL